MKTVLLLLFSGSCLTGFTQLKTTTACSPFVVDILEGKVTGIEPDFTQSQVKQVFPCFTSEEAESSSSKCGGLIAYKDKDIYFYTGRDYIEIGPNFKGKLSIPLMGASRNSLFKILGHPKIKDQKWDAFQTQYGTLILYYNSASRINRIQFSNKSTDTIKLCE